MILCPECGYYNEEKYDEYSPYPLECEDCYRYDICRKCVDDEKGGNVKNRDKYREILMDYAMANASPALTKKGDIRRCDDYYCVECVWNSSRGCEAVRLEWLDEEYREPEDETDWSKVPVDTPILVKAFESDEWICRHFAKYKNGMVYTWNNGATSFSVPNNEHCASWEYAKLAEV